MTLTTICPVCGVTFDARSVLAVYCGVNCKCRAAYYRKQGRPIPAAKQARPQPIRPQVVQPEILDEDANLPAWARACMPPAGTEERVWQGTAIQRREADGFVNATAMCQAGDREWFTYARSARAQEYIAALASHLGVTAELRSPLHGSPQNPAALIHTITTGPNALRGTWIHPRLAIDLARWISPAFAVWMDGWFLESIARPAQPARPPLATGIHIVAPTRRDAQRMWGSALRRELAASLQLLDGELFGTPGLVPSPVTIHVPA